MTKVLALSCHNHTYNKILESDWFLARPIFYQIGARAAKVSNNKVCVLHMHILFLWFLITTENSFIVKRFRFAEVFLECCYSYD